MAEETCYRAVRNARRESGDMKNDRFLKVLNGEAVDKTPIWIMRQAGRYLPEYRALRSEVPDFMTFCKMPELASEVTLQPLRRFDLDAAIIFSDILTVPEAMGMELKFVKGEGPLFPNPITSDAMIEQLRSDPIDDLDYVMTAIRKVKPQLNVPLIGFAGSPWTVATYMIEGGGSKTFSQIKKMRYAQPKSLHALLDKLAHATSIYLKNQIAAGADAIMIFDTWGGVLDFDSYPEFSLHYMQRIVESLPESTPTILFTKNGSPWLEKIAQTGCAGVGLDWTIPLGQARQRVPSNIVLQGNLDPTTLYADDETIVRAVNNILSQHSGQTGHIFNLGHGILPDINPDKVKLLVDTVHAFQS